MTEPESADQVIEDLKDIIRDIEAHLSASGGTQARDALTAAKQRLTQLQDDVLRKAGDALGSARDALEAGESYLRENPWTALAVAAGAGFVLGTLLTRRRS